MAEMGEAGEAKLPGLRGALAGAQEEGACGSWLCGLQDRVNHSSVSTARTGSGPSGVGGSRAFVSPHVECDFPFECPNRDVRYPGGHMEWDSVKCRHRRSEVAEL